MFTTIIKKQSIIWLALAGVFLASCQDNTPHIERQPISFKQYLPIHMAVSKIDVIEEYKPPMVPPNVEHRIPYSPAEAMDIWVKQRLRAVGLENRMEVIIKNGAVTATELPKQSGVGGFFTGEPDRKYEAYLEIEMRIYDESGSAMSAANVNAKASRTIIINESATVQEREEAFRKMITELMTLINAQLEKNMFMFMSGYISFSHNP
jgi:hypothetical protein